MSLVLDNTETDTRTRIILVAERLFREIGYQKTAQNAGEACCTVALPSVLPQSAPK